MTKNTQTIKAIESVKNVKQLKGESKNTVNVLNKFVAVLAHKSAQADKRTEVFYIPLGDNEAHITVSLKPCESGKYAIVRNNEVLTVKHADILPSDSVVMKITVDMFGLTRLTIHRHNGGSEYIKASASLEIAVNLTDESITPLNRDKETKALQLTSMLRFKGSNFATITESELTAFVNERIAKFMAKVANNTPQESARREYKTRDNQTESNLTLFGKYKAQQSAKRANTTKK